ncbi:MAG: recombinase family protein, partial [Candidatus Latescibacteria bacterium]|nr:recombinase family protein [Candidatus Latescibacterota bacterium]
MNITPDRILIIKLRAIGDVVLATPVIENLRKQYPESHIAFLTEEAAADIIKGNPFLDELIILERRKWQQVSFPVSLKEQVDLSTPMGRFMVNVMSSLYQMEREMISERVSDVLQDKKENGVV